MALEHESDSALARAVRAAGSQSAFGRLIGRPQTTVSTWLREERPLPGEYVLLVEQATGISRHALRPDLYPDESGSGIAALDHAAAPGGPPPFPDQPHRHRPTAPGPAASHLDPEVVSTRADHGVCP